MDTISIKQGESLSIGFTFNSSYDESRIVDMLLYLDGVLIGRKSSGTLNKTTCYSAYVSSDETFIMEGYRDVILVLEDVELGVRKFIIAGVEFDKLADEFHADVDNNGYNILLELTVDETTLYGTSTLIEVLRGPSGSGVLPSGGTAGQTIIKNSNIDQDYSWGNPTQVNADWNATSGYAQILNKPNVLTVQQQVDWNATAGVTSILNKPIIITPVNSDWNSTTGLSAILNKPTYFPASDVYPWAKQPEKPQYNYSEILDHPTLISYFTNDAGYTTNIGTVTSITAGIGLTGGTITSSGTISLATQLPNGETATTQPRGDNSNKVATTAYCDNMVQPFSGVTVKPSYLNNGDGSVTIGTGEYTLNSATDGSGYFKTYTITGGTFTLTDGVTNYIYADYNYGTPEIRNITTLSGINDLTTTPIYTLNRVGNYISVLDWDNQGFGLANKLTMRLRQTERFSVVPGGLTIGESATRRITIGAGIVWYGATYVSIPASNSGDGTTQSKLFVYNGSSWSFSLQTQYNNSQYQGASGLVSLSGNQYGVIWVYKGVEASQDQYVVLGTNSYANLSSAQAALVPSNLPPIIPIHTILVGRIIVKNGESIATQIDNYLITGGSSAGISDHTKLSNLTWGSSGHVGTINTFAAFDSNGLAANIPTSNYYLSSNPAGYTSNLGTVTNVSTYIDALGNDIYVETSNSNTAPQINIHIPTASATKRGALSATDWNTFNNKLSSISYNQPSNASYQMLWGSGNGVYGNSNITCNPYTGVLSATQFSGSGAGLTGLTSGQITTAFGSQTAGMIFMAPYGSNGTPGFRYLQPSELPSGSNAYIQNTTGLQTAVINMTGSVTASQFNGSGAGLTGTASSLSVNYAISAGTAGSTSNWTRYSDNGATTADRIMVYDRSIGEWRPDPGQFTKAILGLGSNAYSNTAYQPLSTAINTSNIGSQSVNYANNAGNLGGVDAAYFVQGQNSSRTTNLADFDQYLSSGFYDGESAIGSPSNSWYHIINSAHYNSYSSNKYQFQIASEFWDHSAFYMRNMSPNSIGAWRMLWHDGNFTPSNFSLTSHTHDYATHRGEGSNFIDYARNVYNNGAYSGSGWVEPSDLGVRYAASAGNASTVGGYSASQLMSNSGINATQQTINATGNGSIICSQPFQASSYKKVLIYAYELNGYATYNFPVPFTWNPILTAMSSNISLININTSYVGISATGAVSGWVVLEGY